MTIQHGLRYTEGHGTGHHSAHEKHSRSSQFGLRKLFRGKFVTSTQMTSKSSQGPLRVSAFQVHSDDDTENILPRSHFVGRLIRSDSTSSMRSCESMVVHTHSQQQAYKRYFRIYNRVCFAPGTIISAFHYKEFSGDVRPRDEK